MYFINVNSTGKCIKLSEKFCAAFVILISVRAQKNRECPNLRLLITNTCPCSMYKCKFSEIKNFLNHERNKNTIQLKRLKCGYHTKIVLNWARLVFKTLNCASQAHKYYHKLEMGKINYSVCDNLVQRVNFPKKLTKQKN